MFLRPIHNTLVLSRKANGSDNTFNTYTTINKKESDKNGSKKSTNSFFHYLSSNLFNYLSIYLSSIIQFNPINGYKNTLNRQIISPLNLFGGTEMQCLGERLLSFHLSLRKRPRSLNHTGTHVIGMSM